MNQRPTKADLLAAADKTLIDVIGPGLAVLFCGINPGLYSAAIGHHFGRPGNRFWPALHASGFTPRLLSPYEEAELLPLGYGITNIAGRASATENELRKEEIVAGCVVLQRKVNKHKPRFMAVLGIGAYRIAFNKPKATLGLQDERIGSTRLWVLPNPSGLNAHYQPHDLARVFAELRLAVEEDAG